MTARVRFHPLATAEVVETRLWYEDRAPGLGDRFVAAVGAATSRAAAWPNAGAPIASGRSGHTFGRALAKAGFPYVVVYRATSETVEVLAVHHERRRPLYWADRA